MCEQQIGVRNIQLDLNTGESCITSTSCPNLANATTQSSFAIAELPQPEVSGTCIDNPDEDYSPPVSLPPPPSSGGGRSISRPSGPCGDRPIIDVATLDTTFFDAVQHLHNRGVLGADVGMCIFGTDDMDAIMGSPGKDVISGKGASAKSGGQGHSGSQSPDGTPISQ